ncbi:YdbL family probable chaperone protein [Alloalcanivorax xenomutans]|jgi:uncharacterized protein|uniref:YdbL family protein n=1 Tax=Alloalcanivorax xenomutans TaxID=1094342 RepID=UPI0003B85FD9|nr:YdbL family protein [Alloalcanivorax xenomutans]ERS15436.1 hypothetical protein Q668_05765 [Alcanivorax sp. PN-3]MCE7525628.1 YdbL family protein [Alloalcanivorax xenomutans]CUR45450.1 Putative uncharacterized protein ydbL, may be related to amine metabolism [Alloalcanivorax xenomutans]
MMKIIKVALMVTALTMAGSAFALELDQAKTQGLVGEQPNGYLGVVKATPEAVQLVSEVNEKRRQAYERIARQNGITLEQVANLAGQKAIEKTAGGEYVKTPDGQWIKK